MKRLCADDVTDSMPLFRSGGGGAIPTSALQLKISRCKVHRACDLNALWHSRFPKIDWSNVVRNKDYACYVAEHDDIAYAVAIWSSPIAANRLTEGKTALELRRMAICDNAPPNTASRMIGIMRRIITKEMPHLTLLVSYQDTDVHAGTIYKASGWKAAAQNKGTSWTNENRQRNEEQSLADKVRWEYRIKAATTENNSGISGGTSTGLRDGDNGTAADDSGGQAEIRFDGDGGLHLGVLAGDRSDGDGMGGIGRAAVISLENSPDRSARSD
jgi:hypothetical protein